MNDFGSITLAMISDLEAEARDRYHDASKQEIAILCLNYAETWISEHANTIQNWSRSSRRISNAVKDTLKDECRRFVREKVTKQCKEKYGSVLAFIMIYVILPVVLKWVIERIFDRLSKEYV
jgi:hypothetical protein